MQNVIRALEQIQRIDLEIGSIVEEQRKYLGDIETATVDIAGANDRLAVLTAELGSLKTQVAEFDEKIRTSDEKIKKDEQRINSIKNDRELNALNKEISAANKAKKQCEDDKERTNARIAEKNTEISALQELVAAKTIALQTLTSQLEEKRPVWTDAITEKQKQKEAAGVNVDASIKKKYENIRAKRGGTGLALVKNETCQGCFIHIPPQVYIILKRGVSELMTCPHCHRILYVEADANKETGAAL